METKNVVIIALSTVVLVGGTIAVIKIVKKKKDKKKNGKDAKGEVSDDQTKGVIGKNVRTHPTLGYTNVRSSAAVDDGWAGTWFGYRVTDGNWIGEARSNPIGTVISSLTGDDGFTWYKIKLTKSLGGKTQGYVREDAVSF